MRIIQMKSANANETKLKSVTFSGFEIKDATKGEVRAIVATLGVVDRDGDIIRRDAIENGAKVIVSAWGHDAMWGNRPAGKGTLAIDGDKVVFKGRMFLNTTDGRDTFEVLKEMGADQEWSFGYIVMGWEVPSDDEKKAGAFNILTKLDAFEVSPVLIGAGVGTQTLSTKRHHATETPTTSTAPDPAAAAAVAEAARVAAEAETKRLETERAEAARVEAERVEAERLANETSERSRLAAEMETKRVNAGGTQEFERFNRTMQRFGKLAR